MEISEDQNTITTDDGLVHKVGGFGPYCSICSLNHKEECLLVPCDEFTRDDGLDVYFVTLNEVKNG